MSQYSAPLFRQGDSLEFVAGHAVLEFTAIFIAGGAGLMIGLSLLLPGERTRVEALIENGVTAVKLMAGCFPMFLIAGCIEGFISPLPIHYGYRFAVSAATAIALTAYLLKPDRNRDRRSKSEHKTFGQDSKDFSGLTGY